MKRILMIALFAILFPLAVQAGSCPSGWVAARIYTEYGWRVVCVKPVTWQSGPPKPCDCECLKKIRPNAGCKP